MNRSPLLELHASAGARIQSQSEPPILLTYGDVPGEYRSAQDGAVLFDATTRGRLSLRGADAVMFLHRILANDVRGLGVGQGQRNLLLSSKGKILHELDLFRGAAVSPDEELWISTPPGTAAALAKAFDGYLFSEKVVVTDTSDDHAPLEIAGPRADAIVRAVAGVDMPPGDHAWARASFATGHAVCARVAVAGSPGVRIDAGRELAPLLWSHLREQGAQPAGRIVHDSLRVEACAAEFGVDVDENVYPQEARWESAFSLSKGCYVGQEVVAKIDTYGGLNKRLVALRLSHDDPVARGTRLFRNDDGEWRDLGVVSSWAYSFALDGGLVLGYVKRRHQAIGTVFRVGESDATATIVPVPVRVNALAVTGEFE